VCPELEKILQAPRKNRLQPKTLQFGCNWKILQSSRSVSLERHPEVLRPGALLTGFAPLSFLSPLGATERAAIPVAALQFLSWFTI